MRLLATFLMLIPLAAQEPTTPAPQPAQPVAPQTSTDNWLQGSFEVIVGFQAVSTGVWTPIAAW
jgi:hypothetical protein